MQSKYNNKNLHYALCHQVFWMEQFEVNRWILMVINWNEFLSISLASDLLKSFPMKLNECK